LVHELFRLKNLQIKVRSRCRRDAGFVLSLALFALLAGPGPPVRADERASGASASLHIVGDGVPEPLEGARGDVERGRALLAERAAANCLLCHAIPDPSPRVAGNVGPSLDGVGRKLSAAQLRLRVADIQQVNSATVMPSYYRVDNLDRVAPEYRGKPVLDARQVEDIVAYLQTLK
jgi:sulfur-oxidizing protein SoxX